MLDPFAFFIDQRSALAGLGGCGASADARYCFHTAYVSVRPGPARFHLGLQGVETTQAEINLRVMALRPGHDALMVASRRLDLLRLEGGDLTARLAFTASEGVQYALFAFLTDPVAIAVRALEVSLRELPLALREMAGGRPVSRFAGRSIPKGGVKLFANRAAGLANPTSQPFDPAQAREARALAFEAELAEAEGSQGYDSLSLWCDVLPLRALASAGITNGDGTEPARGILVNAPDGRLASALQVRGYVVSPTCDDGFADFAVGYLGEDAASRGPGEWSEDVIQLFDELMEVLSGGGLAVAIVRFAAGHGDAAVCNVMQQVALHAIGQGHGFHQIARDPALPMCDPNLARGAFALMARRKIDHQLSAQWTADLAKVAEHG